MTLSEHYVSYVSEHGSKPVTVAALCKIVGISEEEFYRHHSSLSSLEDSIWKGWIEQTIQTISASEAYGGYSVREKYLAFCFGLTQQFLSVRSFISWRFSSCRMKELQRFSRFKEALKDHLNALTNEGLESGEIPTRLGLHRLYADAAWLHLLALIKFWVADTSEAFEKTDTFIEKSTNFQMDVITRNGLDSGAELGKFFFQQIWK